MYHKLTSLSPNQTCQQCGKNISMSSFFKSNLFGAADIKKYMNAYLSGSVEQMGGTGGVEKPGSYRLSYSSLQAYCEECLEMIDDNIIIDAVKSEKPVKCGKCSHAMPIKLPDDFIHEFHPKAIAVVNDSEGIDEAERNTGKKSMLVFSCMSCGAGLELDADTGRTIKCKYCDNENYLPDSIWTKLHPHKEVSPLFVILDLDGSDLQEAMDYSLNVSIMKVYDRHFENFIREYFEKPFSSDAVNVWFKVFLSAENNKQNSFSLDIEKIQKSFYSQMQLGYENHNIRLREITAESGKSMHLELQNKIASDTDENVRLKLAVNNKIHKDILKKLQNDSSPVVSAEAKKHKTGFLKSLFG